MRRTVRGSIRPPRAPTNTAAPASGPASTGRPSVAPLLDGTRRRQPDRDGAFLGALAEDADDAALAVDVVDVEADQLTHPDAGGVEQLQHGAVAQAVATTSRVGTRLARCRHLVAELVEEGRGRVGT